MSFKRDSFAVLLDRVYANYTSVFRPLDKTPRHNLLKVFASADAGIYHQLLGDLDFLAKQIFPDTATGAYLREHWSSRVAPLYAVAAIGEASITGMPNRPIPAGVVFAAASGERYYIDKSYRLDENGAGTITVKAENPGAQGNLAAGEKLIIASAIPVGIDSQAEVSGAGIAGGTDAESDEEYLARVLAALRNSSRYGREGDFALWAKDSSAEVSAAWEFRNFGIFGALLIQVIRGNQFTGVERVGNLEEVRNYINENAPPVVFEVRTPLIVNINPSIALLPEEDTETNRELAVSRLKTYLQITAKPGAQITAGALRLAITDGIAITDAAVKIGGSAAGLLPATILEYPYIGEVSWE